jgi:hypothetical protein
MPLPQRMGGEIRDLFSVYDRQRDEPVADLGLLNLDIVRHIFNEFVNYPARPRIPSESCRALQFTGPAHSLHGFSAGVSLSRRIAFAIWSPTIYGESMGKALPHPVSRHRDGSRLTSASIPIFHVFEFLRIGEYSLRNSVSRCGIEMVYAALPDKLRVEVRPLVDVVGERIGDMSAAGILHLLSDNAGMNFRYTLIVVASFGAALWIGSEWLLRRVEHMKAAAKRDNENQLPLQKLAREEPFSLNGRQFAAGGRRI